MRTYKVLVGGIVWLSMVGVAMGEGEVKCKTPAELGRQVKGEQLNCLAALERVKLFSSKAVLATKMAPGQKTEFAYSRCGFANLKIISKCPGFKVHTRKLAKQVHEHMSNVIRGDKRLAEEKRLAENRKRDQVFKQMVAALPRFRKFINCAKCTDGQAINGYQLAADMCSMDEGRREAEDAIKKERKYGRRHGVVDLHKIKEFSDYIREMDEELERSGKDYKDLIGKKFRLKRCKLHSKIFKGVVLPFGTASYSLFQEG